MKLLVTGGAGFIGSNFVHLLHHWRGAPSQDCCPDQHLFAPPRARDHSLVIVDALTYAGTRRNLPGGRRPEAIRFERADIRDSRAMAELFRRERPGAVVHFAAESHVDRSIESGQVFASTNVAGTQVLLDAARRNDVDRFLHVSTDEVYGSLTRGRAAESAPLRPSSPYAASKAGADLLVLAHCHTYGTDALIARCVNNFGPRQHPEKFLAKVITNALSGTPVPIYGTGRNRRNWLYVKDHGAALHTILHKGKPGQVYNVSGDAELPNADLARRVLGVLGRPLSLLRRVEDRPGHDWRYAVDDRKLRGLGWKPVVSFAQGLALTVAWFRSAAAKEASR